MRLLEDRIAVVTGGGNGIGKAIAIALAEEGARVVIADIHMEAAFKVEEHIRQNGGTCLVVEADVVRKTDVERIFDETLRVFGKVDILINNVGGTIRKAMVDFTEDEWDQIIDINLKSTFLCSQAAGKIMLKQKRGAIVNISSIHGLGGIPNRSPYATAKAAINSFTSTIGCEWAADGVRMNAVVPGYILTEGLDHTFNAGLLNREDMVRRTPQGRLGTPEDIAEAALFLVSDKAKFITGTTLYVDGGYSAYHAPEIQTSVYHQI
ncbi:SDR family NAD(P)-dependent oxidoreductase [Paenibacillus sp. OV219]|uniref:SDR family NAD(P)-dependent oxidoreductase n=1 Tax=Paenibacillus sp. OV219 TaxID=1884377 RepID=UPI0008BBAE62|nr:glucose 1-dehydrogenase [Paenibacillus sp. OV219]SEN98422.1 gluconate 5-dehydrogenase/3-oxoacyl-[acyl-carrier protein] reductase [Paenibacillus sp. OV219]